MGAPLLVMGPRLLVMAEEIIVIAEEIIVTKAPAWTPEPRISGAAVAGG